MSIFGYKIPYFVSLSLDEDEDDDDDADDAEDDDLQGDDEL